MSEADRQITLWREPGAQPLEGVQLSRAGVTTLGIGIVADYLHELYYDGSFLRAVALHEGFTAQGKLLDREWPIIVLGFTPNGPIVMYPGSLDGVGLVALEASVALRELCTFEQQQSLMQAAMQQAHQAKLMAEIMRGVPTT